MARFGIPQARLLRGDALRRAAHIGRGDWGLLKAEGIRQGADPSQWLGALKQVKLAEVLQIEIRAEAGEWQTCPLKLFVSDPPPSC